MNENPGLLHTMHDVARFHQIEGAFSKYKICIAAAHPNKIYKNNNKTELKLGSITTGTVLLVDKEKQFSRMKVWISPQKKSFSVQILRYQLQKLYKNKETLRHTKATKASKRTMATNMQAAQKNKTPNKQQTHHSPNNIENMFYNGVCLQLHAISERIRCVLTSNDKGAQRRRV